MEKQASTLNPTKVPITKVDKELKTKLLAEYSHHSDEEGWYLFILQYYYSSTTFSLNSSNSEHIDLVSIRQYDYSVVRLCVVSILWWVFDRIIIMIDMWSVVIKKWYSSLIMPPLTLKKSPEILPRQLLVGLGHYLCFFLLASYLLLVLQNHVSNAKRI